MNFIGDFISSSDLSLKTFLWGSQLILTVSFFKIIIASNTPSLSGQVHDAFFFICQEILSHSCVLFIEFKLEHCHCDRHQNWESCFSRHSPSQVMWQSLGCSHCLCFCFLAFTSSGFLPPFFFFPDYTKGWILRSLTGVMKLRCPCSLPCVALHFLSKVFFWRKWSIKFVSIWQLCASNLVFTQLKKISICVVLWNFFKAFRKCFIWSLNLQ